MNPRTSMLLTLLWKEWTEQRWRIAFGCTIIGSLALLGFFIRLMSDQNIANLTAILAALLTFLVGIGLVSPERESGTLRTLLILPIRPRTVLLAKLIIALVASLAPIATAALIAFLMATGREQPAPRLLLPYLLAVPLALTLLIWTSVITIRARSEAMAGLFLVIALTILAVVGAVLGLLEIDDRIYEGIHPFVFADAMVNGLHKLRAGICIAQISLTLAFAAILFWQFPRLGRSK